MKTVKHISANQIRRDLLVRISYVIRALALSERNADIGAFLGLSASTVSRLRNYNAFEKPKYLPLANIDRMMVLCEKLYINYEFKVVCKNGKTQEIFTASTVVNWSEGCKKSVLKAMANPLSYYHL